MNPKKHRTLLVVFVGVMVFGLVATYVPMLFSPIPAPLPEGVSSDQSASLTEPELPPSPPEATTTSPAKESNSDKKDSTPSGFSGLNEENQSLDNLDDLLNSQ